MSKSLNSSPQTVLVEDKIFMIRGKQVMLDHDLAELYGVETKRVNEQVKRNADRFPKEFCFQITRDEAETVKSQIATSRNISFFSGQGGGRRKLPYAFTEQGVAMLSAVLHSCHLKSKKWVFIITVLAACLLSAGIEFLQLILKLGFSEFDDVIDNTAGE